MCSMSAYPGLEVLSPVIKPIGPHCKVLQVPRASSASSGPVFEDLAGGKGAWSEAVLAEKRLFRTSPSLAFPIRPLASLLACASGPQERP